MKLTKKELEIIETAKQDDDFIITQKQIWPLIIKNKQWYETTMERLVSLGMFTIVNNGIFRFVSMTPVRDSQTKLPGVVMHE